MELLGKRHSICLLYVVISENNTAIAEYAEYHRVSTSTKMLVGMYGHNVHTIPWSPPFKLATKIPQVYLRMLEYLVYTSCVIPLLKLVVPTLLYKVNLVF